MRRKIILCLAGISAILLGILLWRLDIPHWKRLDTDRIYAQPQASVVYDAAGEAIAALSSGETRAWTVLSDIPEQTRLAFIAAEDQRFYEHCGISIRRILAAALSNLRSGGYDQGASTITQQLIKLTHLSSVKTLSRKAQEAFLALQLERRLSKDEILECYLNTVYFGRGSYGITAAARTYFNKEASALTLAEAALLAGIIKAPSSYAPHLNPEKAVERRNIVLRQMADCGFISSRQADNAAAEPLALSLKESDAHRFGWYTDAALEESAALLGLTVDDLLASGHAIYTAFEPALQDAADTLFTDAAAFPPDAADGTPVQAAFIAMRPDTGEICALVGGREYAVRRGLNRATQIRRSPGSAIKPVSVYAAAIDAYGFTPVSFVEDTPRTFSGGYSPGNAGGGFYGTVTLREALSRSLNIASVDLAELIGVQAVRNYAARFGLPLALQDDNLALALGSMTHGVSPANLCAAYAAIANGGLQVEPHIVRRIENADGQILWQAPSPERRAVKSSTAFMLSDMLTTAASTGSARALASVGIPVAAKTGTVSDADGSTRDIWTAACTPDIALTVWMGFDSPGEERRLSASEGGSGYPARLCASFLKASVQHLSGETFSRPDDVRLVLLDRLALEQDSVRLATEKTPADYVTAELFHADALPTEFSDNWTAPVPVDDLTLLSGSGETPVLQFTARSDLAEYLLLRTADGITESAAVLTGAPGEVLRFADKDADPNTRIRYSILPRHRLLYERGTLLTGKESAAVAYSPGGILDFILGPDQPEATPDIKPNKTQSIFG